MFQFYLSQFCVKWTCKLSWKFSLVSRPIFLGCATRMEYCNMSVLSDGLKIVCDQREFWCDLCCYLGNGGPNL